MFNGMLIVSKNKQKDHINSLSSNLLFNIIFICKIIISCKYLDEIVHWFLHFIGTEHTTRFSNVSLHA